MAAMALMMELEESGIMVAVAKKPPRATTTQHK